jgi:hypothetical protein
MKIKICILRTPKEASNPLCSAPFVVSGFQDALLLDREYWTSLPKRRDMNRWAFICRGMEGFDPEATRESYRLVELATGSLQCKEAVLPLDLEGIIIPDTESWSDWEELSRNNPWLLRMRKYQLRSGDISRPTKRGPRLSVLYAIATVTLLLDQQPIGSNLDQLLESYVQFRISKNAPSLGLSPAGWVRP